METRQNNRATKGQHMKLALAFALFATPALSWETVYAVNEGQPNCVAVVYNNTAAFRVIRPLAGGTRVGVFFPLAMDSRNLTSALYLRVDRNTPYALHGAQYGGGKVEFAFSRGEEAIANRLISELASGRKVSMIYDNGKTIASWPLQGAAAAINGTQGCLAAGGKGYEAAILRPGPDGISPLNWRRLNRVVDDIVEDFE
jgi:hypothetical protein